MQTDAQKNKPRSLEILDIVVSIYNQEKLIERVLGGIFRCTTTPFNLVLVFDGCTDDTKAVALKFIEATNQQIRAGQRPALLRDLRVADAPNVFETRANNIGFRLATTDFILTVQDDVEILEKGWERRMTWPHRRWDDVFAVTGRGAMTILVDERNSPSFPDHAAREFLNLPRRTFAIRSAINRGPVALRADILRKMDFLDEAFAPAQLDEADAVMRAYGQFGMRSGAVAVGWRSDLAWGKTRGADSTMNTNRTRAKKSALLRARHPDFTGGKLRLVESRPMRDAEIDYRGRDPLMKRKSIEFSGWLGNARWLLSRKWHAAKVRFSK